MSVIFRIVEWACRLYGVTLGRLLRHRIILCYHNVGTPGGSTRGWIDDARLVDSSEFEQQLRWLKSNFDVVSLDQLLDNESPGRSRVAITFDDGYFNNIDKVMPLMERLQLPMTWFVATAFVDDQKLLPWWDLLDLILCKQNSRIELVEPEIAGAYDLSNSQDRLRLRHAVRQAMKSVPPFRCNAIRKELEQQFEPQTDLPDNAFARSAEIAALDFDRFELGGHSVTHPNLASCSETERREEIQAGKTRLEEISGQALRWFAYPYGERESFDAETARTVAQSGFDGALTLVPGLVRRQRNQYMLPRILISPGQSQANFKAKVAGAPIFVMADRLREWLKPG